MTTLSRKEREYLVRRDEILESAQKLFAQKGFFKTTIQDIARESEFAIATLYNFFKSKDELYTALIERKTENLFKSIQESALNHEGIKKIDNVVYAVLEFFENDKDFFKLYVSERGGFEWDIRSELGETCHKMRLQYLEFLKSVIEESIERGELKDKNPWDVSFFLSGIINSFIFQWVNSPKPYSLFDKHKTIMELFLSGVKKE